MQLQKKANVWKGLVAGLVGGLVATWTMDHFQEAWSRGAELVTPNGHSKQPSGQNGEDAMMKTAEVISESLTGQMLTKKQKKKAGTFIHYAFGTLMGGVYGIAAEFSPPVKSIAGLPFGTALFLGADEIALPVLKLSKGPTSYPASRHVYGFTSHLVWAGTTELVRRIVLRVL